ncbi:hypothetical protein M0C34_01345 [Agarivorans sp. TSD2052]|uniref:hypothetical protein n=1 Tax=Agarivorans sp. TSD2052 TaxID=2937286 RepID=UPI00200EEF5F|nr:hypothetical protein [Agarivorans sp. TSD2052]UPW18949.1 hypothetical protein M0C34_01345 [Agarivorans sp. TSD2052]
MRNARFKGMRGGLSFVSFSLAKQRKGHRQQGEIIMNNKHWRKVEQQGQQLSRLHSQTFKP